VALDGRYEACAAGGVAEIGMRPEDLRLVQPGAEGIAGEVYVVEPMGAETLVDVLVGDTRVTVRAERGFQAAIGSPIAIAIDPSSACFFDRDGTTVVHRTTAAPERPRGGGA
jgi:multiple sugar transport system ATP-binding protein